MKVRRVTVFFTLEKTHATLHVKKIIKRPLDTSEILFPFLYRYDEELAQSDLLNLPDPKSRSGTGITGFRAKEGRRPAATWK